VRISAVDLGDCRAQRLRRRDAVRLNAARAVEYDAVRRVGRDAELRLAAGVLLTARVEVAEALLAGVPVPADRLDPAWTTALGLAGDVVVTTELALRVLGHGPIEAAA